MFKINLFFHKNKYTFYVHNNVKPIASDLL